MVFGLLHATQINIEQVFLLLVLLFGFLNSFPLNWEIKVKKQKNQNKEKSENKTIRVKYKTQELIWQEYLSCCGC